MADKLSMPMCRVLRNVLAGHDTDYHCRTQSDYGGLTGTVFALKKRGLLTEDCHLTAEGRAMARSLTNQG